MFPSLKARDLLSILLRAPFEYRVVRQSGSHRRLESSRGFPPLTFSFHDGDTIPPGLVRKTLCKDIGLTEEEALKLV